MSNEELDRVARSRMPGALVRVLFELEVDEDGWPPVSGERLWAERRKDGLFRIDNIPFFVRSLAADDLVRAESGDGVLVASEIVEWSGNCTIRIIPFRAGPLEGSLEAVIDVFADLGVARVGAGEWPIVALSVPPEAALGDIKRLLADGEANGSWTVEEACIGDDWAAT